ncbi:MAG TPA: exonuclease domain-containing protein [Bacillus sp. (in: firmicutes)]|nr:exonuclease domain-containing protein [Bacillus sp. (in: firmicutes)]
MAFEQLIQFMRGISGKVNSGIFGGVPGQNMQQMAFLRQIQKEINGEEVLGIPLHELDVVVLDIETTGFFPDKGDEIISIGAIKVRGGEIQEGEVFYSLVRFEQALSSEIEELTGISSQELKDAPLLSEVLVRFFDFARGSPLVAHHANHEKIFLQHASWKVFRTSLKHRIVDTSFLYRIAEPDLKLVRLEDFCEHNAIPIKDRHHALGDAVLTANLWCLYINKVQELGCRTLGDIYERLARL